MYANNTKEQNEAAKVLINNLDSNDIIDLIEAVIHFYDRFTMVDKYDIGLAFYVKEHIESERRKVIAKKLKVLNIKYNDTYYTDPDIPPKNVKDLLIKFVWLSFYQLPEYKIDSKKYLNWDVFHNWTLNVQNEMNRKSIVKSSQIA